MLIGISGKKQTGKDTIGKIIQVLSINDKYLLSHFEDLIIKNDVSKFGFEITDVEIRKFADKLKEVVVLLLNCSPQDLEDIDFKNKILPERWWYYRYRKYIGDKNHKHIDVNDFKYVMIPYSDGIPEITDYEPELIKLTPRKMLQLLGTECGREIIHPNIWVNSLFEEFTKKSKWVITDVRFENEVNAIKQRGGVVIRVDRDGIEKSDTHESETALDNYDGFDYKIKNDNIEDLVKDVKKIYKETQK